MMEKLPPPLQMEMTPDFLVYVAFICDHLNRDPYLSKQVWPEDQASPSKGH